MLGSNSEPLDVGRSSRTITAGLRRAVAIRDRGCAYPGCGRPPSWCDVHHIQHWVDGGATELGNLTMLCTVHHQIVHGAGWLIRMEHGHPEFTPPEWLGLSRYPRQKAIA